MTKRFTVAPYQDADDPAVTDELRAACEFAMHVVTADGEVIRAGRAVLHIFGGLGWPGMGLLALPPLIWFIELGYTFIARNRRLASRFFFRTDHDA
ncbi:MAG: DUF393 domain-containing protein [Proteobacteria bacterium]|nr:DUF393 domain-containing protein [Pseudomonadota bacterium]